MDSNNKFEILKNKHEFEQKTSRYIETYPYVQPY